MTEPCLKFLIITGPSFEMAEVFTCQRHPDHFWGATPDGLENFGVPPFDGAVFFPFQGRFAQAQLMIIARFGSRGLCPKFNRRLLLNETWAYSLNGQSHVGSFSHVRFALELRLKMTGGRFLMATSA